MAEGARDEDEFGPYRIRELLGQGGMGQVHRAYDRDRERTVALKRLRTDLARDDGSRERFRRESRLAARLTSPHCVPIHDFGEIDGTLYIDMRLVDGHDLDAELRDGRRITPDRAVTIVEQVADALTCAHRDGLVHRDVKPSNVLLARSCGGDFAYLVDFGVVRNLDAGTMSSLTGTGNAIGTLAYMAPEVLSDGRVDQRVDVYALACVRWQMLCGRKPFDGTGPALLYQHLHTPPPAASSVIGDLPPALDDVLLRGMGKDPAARPSGADELAGAARRALNPAPAPVTGPRATPPEPTTRIERPRTGRSRRVIAVTGVLAALAVVLGGVGHLVLSGAFDPPDTSALRRTFTEIAERGPACRDVDPAEAVAEADIDADPQAAVGCDSPATAGRLYFVEWAAPADAREFVTAVAAGRTSSTGDAAFWQIRDEPQGPLYIGPSAVDGFVTAGAYDDRRFGFVATAPSQDQAERTFTDPGLPKRYRVPTGSATPQ